MFAFRKNTGTLGDLAEVIFTERALRRGHSVSRPYGNCWPYDVIVGGASRRLRRVQVKSAWTMGWPGGYRVDCRAASGPVYTKQDIDLLAAYVAPEDAWYLIPVEALPPKPLMYLFPHDPARDLHWRRYREAWWRLGRVRLPLPQYAHVLRRKFLPRHLALIAY
jgi:hypothetical protein